eukprot:6214782-Pleurochrysis_carterae.AAC.3
MRKRRTLGAVAKEEKAGRAGRVKLARGFGRGGERVGAVERQEGRGRAGGRLRGNEDNGHENKEYRIHRSGETNGCTQEVYAGRKMRASKVGS